MIGRIVRSVAALAALALMAGSALAAPVAGEATKTASQPVPDAERDSLPGAKLFTERCAMCHLGGVAKAPALHFLEMLPAAAVVNTLKNGVMATQGKGLSDADRLHIAEYITKQTLPNGLPEVTYAPACTGEAAKFDAAKPVVAAGWGWDTRRFVPGKLAGLDAASLGSLELKWAYAFPNATRARSQPVIAWGAVFVGSEDGRVYAFDLKTGCARWTFEAQAEVRTAIVAVDGPEKRVYFGDLFSKLYAVDALTGKLVWSQRVDDHPSATLTATPLYRDGTLYVPVSSLEEVPAVNPDYPCCTFRGQVAAVEAKTGKVKWRFYTIPTPAKSLGKGPDGVEHFAPSGAPVWVSPTFDDKRKLIYVGSGDNYSSPSDDNSDALFALDIRTGQVKWKHQTTTRDAWNAACMVAASSANCPEEKGPDFDYSSSPLLIDLPGRKDILVTGHKNGSVYAFDPDTRAVLWQTKIGRGSIQGGVHFGMAVEGTTAYVPINDMNNTRNGQILDAAAARPGMHAIDLATGKVLWDRLQGNVCGEGREFCDPGISAAVTAIPGAVIAGHMDGHLRAYAKEDGRLLWDFDTAKSFPTVNGMKGHGGSMSGPGVAVGDGYVAANSGYGVYSHEAGNLFLVFGRKAQ